MTPPIPASARRSLKCSKLAGSWFVGRQVRGLCVKIWTQSPPKASIRSMAVWIPPEVETWAPSCIRLTLAPGAPWAPQYATEVAVRVRFAPSPTGFLHIGSVHTALFNWLFARHKGGEFLLRIENTDTGREVAAATEQIQESLRWLGLDWDGDVTFQLDRMPKAQEVANQLVVEEKAYEDEGAIRFRMPDEGTTAWDDLIERFSLDRVGKSAATFDYEKLTHMNGLYLRALPPGKYADRLVAYLREQGYEWHEDLVRKVAPLVQEKIATLGEFPSFARFFFERVPPEGPLEDGAVLPAAAEVLARVEPFEAAAIEAALRELAERLSLKPRQAFQPIRLALTGSNISPGLFESLELLGREESIARISAPGSGFGGASGSSAR